MRGSDGRRGLFTGDERGVTVNDSVAAGTLIVIALLLSGGLGLAILTGANEEAGPPTANFTFRYFGENGALIVTHSRGDQIPAGNLVLSDEDTSTSWATVAGMNNSTMVGQGDTIQLSRRSAFGSAIGVEERVRVRWVTANRTKVLATWQKGGQG